MYRSFHDFYPFYLSQHRHPVTRALHILGLILVFYCLGYVICTGRWLGLLALPIAGYGPAWIGHFFFEKNMPATFQYPFYSLMGDFVMFWETITGRGGGSKSMQR
jgi:hypothetical protein